MVVVPWALPVLTAGSDSNVLIPCFQIVQHYSQHHFSHRGFIQFLNHLADQKYGCLELTSLEFITFHRQSGRKLAACVERFMKAGTGTRQQYQDDCTKCPICSITCVRAGHI